MPFLIIVAICLIAIVSFLSSPKGRGWLGEICVKLVIGKTKPNDRYVINDFRLRTSNGRTSQIDHIVINRNGVFVIETKNYSGRIYGQEQSQEWTQVLNYGKVKNKFYNPVKQNKTHVYHISNIIGAGVPIISAVVFVKGNVHFINSTGVYTLGGLRALVKNTNGLLTPQKMEFLHTKLLEANDRSVTNAEHIENIRVMQYNMNNNICPRCGKNLVMRNGKNGRFMGCEGYPNCKFTKNI